MSGSAEEAFPIIGKGWNILRFALASQTFMPTYYDQFELLIKPLFEFITDPMKIDFEDDILLSIKTMIKMKKEVTDTVWVMIPCFPKVLEKNKHAFGNVMDTINRILLVGKDHCE